MFLIRCCLWFRFLVALFSSALVRLRFFTPPSYVFFLCGVCLCCPGANVVPPLGQALAMSPREICHSYTTFNTCYNDTGLFGIYAIAPRKYTLHPPIPTNTALSGGIAAYTIPTPQNLSWALVDSSCIHGCCVLPTYG